MILKWTGVSGSFFNQAENIHRCWLYEDDYDDDNLVAFFQKEKTQFFDVEFILKFKSNKAGLEAHTIGTFVHHDNDDRIILYMARKVPFFDLPFAINFFDYDKFKSGHLKFIKNRHNMKYSEKEEKAMNRFLKNLSWAKIPDTWQ